MPRQKTVTVGQKEYKLQSVPAMWYLQHCDSCRGKNGLNTPIYVKGLFEHAVVEPKGLKIDDFDDNIGDLQELVDEVESFLKAKS